MEGELKLQGKFNNVKICQLRESIFKHNDLGMVFCVGCEAHS